MEASVVQQDIRFSFPTQEETIFVLRYRRVVGQKLSDVQHLIRILYHVISLSGRLGAVGYQEKFRHFFHTSGATHNWFGNTYLALSVQIPLFDGNDKRLKVRQYRYDKLQAETAFDRQRKQLDKEYADASRQLRHNLEVFRTQKDSYHQAEDVYEVTAEKYKEGVASMTELLQDEMRLRAAQAACVQAHCQCNVAQLTLLKLSGHLTELSR